MSRQSILTMVRSRLSVTGEDQTRRQSVQARLQAHQENTRPGIGNLKGGAR
ncbi:MAG: hypothetical protein ACI805_002561, partial [Candidatus Azotimanducaceae bacterium]